jgi:hypothetical protein
MIPHAITPQSREALADGCRRFLLAGGRVTLTEWARLTEAEQDALVVAGCEVLFPHIVEDEDDEPRGLAVREEYRPAQIDGVEDDVDRAVREVIGGG